jgi:hypothetical protein
MLLGWILKDFNILKATFWNIDFLSYKLFKNVGRLECLALLCSALISEPKGKQTCLYFSTQNIAKNL